MAEILAIKPAALDGPVAARLDKGVLRLTLVNPPANALSLSAMAALTAELDRARTDRAVRVIGNHRAKAAIQAVGISR